MRRLLTELVFALALVLTAGAAQAQDKAAVVVLRWDPVAEAATYELQISPDKEFQGSPEHEATVDVAGYRWRSLPNQTLYWRVRSVDADGRRGPWSRVKTIGAAVATPVVEAPVDQKQLLCAERCVAEVSLRPDPFVDRFVIEWWREGAENAVQAVETRAATATIDVGAPGRFGLRVSAVDLEGRKVDAGPARAFELFARAPIPTFPPAGAAVQLQAPGAIAFKWSSNPGDSGFEVELRNRKGVVRRFAAAEPSVEARLEMNGEFSWRVKSKSSLFSPWVPFSALAPPPVLASPVDAASFSTAAAAKRVRFAWQTGAAASVLELSPDADFKAPRVVPIAGGQVELKVPLGQSFWRVSTVDAAGVQSMPSAPRALLIQAGPPLAAPVVLSPEEGDYSQAELAKLRWTPVAGATRYELEAAFGSDDFPAATSVNGTEHALVVPREGAVRVRVRAIDADDAPSGWSSVRVFHRGVAPVAKAVVETPFAIYEADEVVLPVRFVDARGRAVETKTAVVKVGAGEVRPVSATEYRFRAPENVARDEQVELTVVDRDFTYRQMLQIRSRNRLLRVGASLGYGSNLGHVSGALTQGDLSVRTPLLDSRVLAALRVGLLMPGRPIPLGGGLGSAQVRATSVGLLGAFEQPVGRFSLYAGLGPQAHFTEVALESEAESRWSLGGQAVLGALTRLPFGLARAEVGYGVGRTESDLARFRVGLLSLSVGFAWEP